MPIALSRRADMFRPDCRPHNRRSEETLMAGTVQTSPPIESRNDLVEALSRGSKPKDEWRIGTEHEKHVFHRRPLSPVAYEGDHGVKALLDGLAERTGWRPFYDSG